MNKTASTAEFAPSTTVSIPPGACDCHVHIYEDRFALSPTATFRPPSATVEDYRSVQRALGLERVVLVQPTGYGFDNACLLEALSALGPTSARGVVVVPPDVSEGELRRLHDQGVRGVRFMLLAGAGGVLPWDALEPVAARIAPLGWHIDLQIDGRELPRHRALIDRLPAKVVIDHTGKFIEPVPVDHPSFKLLQSVLDRPDRWIKLAAPYETSKLGPPAYADVSALARSLASSHARTCVWASNWPHPNRVPAPDNAALLALLCRDWAPDEKTLQQILVCNPAALYGFA